MAREVIRPDELFDATELDYTHAIVADGTLYMSGQIGADENGEVVGDDVSTQTRQAFENVGTILDEVERDFDDVVKITSYLVGPQDHYEEYKSAWREFFAEPYPCHTMLGVEQLARDDLLVELEVEVPIEE